MRRCECTLAPVCVCVFAPGLQLQRSLFSRHQEGPGDGHAAGLFELDAQANRRSNWEDERGSLQPFAQPCLTSIPSTSMRARTPYF